jgi:hypothetical protein
MNCLYYLAPTLDSTHRITDDLHGAGIEDFYLHVVSRDESGLKNEHIHSSNYLETHDIVRDGIIGAAFGFLAGLAGAALLMYFQPMGPGIPSIVYLFVVFVATMFGAWEGGLAGIDSENKKLTKFRHDIDAGRYLILIYARRGKGAAVRAMMRARHPEADLVAMDRNYFNPFSAVRKRARVARRREARAQQLLQKN